MKKVLIICAAGMSSSLLARKLTDFFAGRELPIEVDATTVATAGPLIERDDIDLYMVSPQAKMNYDKLKKQVDKYDKPIVNIPANSYLPTDPGVNAIARQIFTELREELQKEAK